MSRRDTIIVFATVAVLSVIVLFFVVSRQSQQQTPENQFPQRDAEEIDKKKQLLRALRGGGEAQTARNETERARLLRSLRGQ